RVGFAIWGRKLSEHLAWERAREPFYDVRNLFWVTVATYAASWFVEIVPMEILFNASQIIAGALSFREVLLCLLWLTIFSRREGYRYGLIALVVAVVPRFISVQSNFKELIFMVLVVMLVEFKPWIKTARQHTLNRQILVTTAI